jgi:cytochrome c-type biogenesis protein CcmE
MKTVHIAIIALLGIGIAVAVSLYGNTSQYITFDVAKEYAVKYPNKEFHVVGSLNKNEPMVYNPLVDANRFEFYMNDTLGQLSKVIYYNSKPQDIEKTERIVCIGKYNGDVFEASQILSKCPSKYNDEITDAN